MSTKDQIRLLGEKLAILQKQIAEAVELLDTVAKAAVDDSREIEKLEIMIDNLQDEKERAARGEDQPWGVGPW